MYRCPRKLEQMSVGNAAHFRIGETLQIDNEQMIVSGVDTVHKRLTVFRGANQTTAAAHLYGANVRGIVTTLDVFTLAYLVNNSAPSNANIDGLYLTAL